MTSKFIALTKPEQRLIGAVADAFFPPGGPIPLSGTEAGAVEYFDRYLHRSDTRTAILMRLLIVFTEMSPIALGHGWKRFTQLSRADQIQHLHEAFTSRIYFRRVSFTSFSALMTMAYLANEEVARHMNMKHDADPFGLGAQEEMESSGARPKVATPIVEVA